MKKPKGLTIRKMKEILRLHFGLNLTQSQTAKSLNISAGVVSKYVNQAKAMQISWPLPDDMTELNSIMPKMSPLNPLYLTKKHNVFQKISKFVEKFKGVGGSF